MNKKIRMRHLRTFLEVAGEKSLTRAAEKLGTVQPAVSRTLAELEAEVGQDLFVRTNRGVVLTRAGETLYTHAQGAMLQLAMGIEYAQGQGREQSVTIGVLPNMARKHAPAVISRFKSLYPEVRVIVESRFYADTLGRVRSGAVDMVIGRMLSPNWLQGLAFESLFEEPIIFVASPDHPLAGQSGLRPAALRDFPMLMPIEDTILRFELDTYLISHEVPGFPDRIETVSYDFTRAYLEQNPRAIGCIPLGAAEPELDAGALVRLDLPVKDLVGHVGITTPALRDLSVPAQNMIRLLRERFDKRDAP